MDRMVKSVALSVLQRRMWRRIMAINTFNSRIGLASHTYTHEGEVLCLRWVDEMRITVIMVDLCLI